MPFHHTQKKLYHKNVFVFQTCWLPWRTFKPWSDIFILYFKNKYSSFFCCCVATSFCDRSLLCVEGSAKFSDGYLPRPWRWWWCRHGMRRGIHRRGTLRHTCRQRRPLNGQPVCRRSNRHRAHPERWAAAPSAAPPNLHIFLDVCPTPTGLAIPVAGPVLRANRQSNHFRFVYKEENRKCVSFDGNWVIKRKKKGPDGMARPGFHPGWTPVCGFLGCSLKCRKTSPWTARIFQRPGCRWNAGRGTRPYQTRKHLSNKQPSTDPYKQVVSIRFHLRAFPP